MKNYKTNKINKRTNSHTSGKHQASKRGYKHKHTPSKGEMSYLAVLENKIIQNMPIDPNLDKNFAIAQEVIHNLDG